MKLHTVAEVIFKPGELDDTNQALIQCSIQFLFVYKGDRMQSSSIILTLLCHLCSRVLLFSTISPLIGGGGERTD